MHWLRKSRAAAGLLGLCLVLPLLASAAAQETAAGPPRQESPSELAREGIEQMMRALGLLVESIPQYELPEVLENGDIIIRRKQGRSVPPAQEPEIDETAT
jgi:hypothetical protein